MKLNIAICEDDRDDCQKLHDFLQTYALHHDLLIQLTDFSNGEDFLSTHTQQPFDIVFMDIYLTGMNGTDVIASGNYESLQTVFTTTSREFAIEAFNLNASHYLLKPITYEAIDKAMKRCLATKDVQHFRCLEIKTNQGLISLPVHQIIYIEVFNKLCSIHTEKNIFHTYSSLDSLFELLDSHTFMRAQRSYIVNMNDIESFYFDHIVLSNGKEIMLSRNTRSELKKQYQQFLFRLARRRPH